MDDRALSCREAAHTRRVSLSHSGPRIPVAQKSSRAGRRAGGGSHRRSLPPRLQGRPLSFLPRRPLAGT